MVNGNCLTHRQHYINNVHLNVRNKAQNRERLGTERGGSTE